MLKDIQEEASDEAYLDGEPSAERRQETPPAGKTERADTAEAEDAAMEDADGATPDAPKKRRSRAPLFVILAIVAGAGGWYGYEWWTNGRFHVSTDDAYVDARVAVIAPKVSGYVAEVRVEDNEAVRRGDALIVIEDGDYRDALRTATAQLDAQRAAIASADRQIEAARAAVAQAEARRESARSVVAQAEADYGRYGQLAQTSIVSSQKLDEARSAAETAEASLSEMEAGVVSAEAQLAVVEAQKVEAEAALAGLAATRDHAARTLEAAVLRAPFDGVVGNLSAAVGDYVTPGKRMLAVAPLDAVFVEANFKETQLDGIRPGAVAELSVDAYPDLEIEGRVESIAPASGAVFSLLPPENATGNFTKVVQRVPVRIAVPAEVAARQMLRPGMSVIVSIDTRTPDAPPAGGLTASAAESQDR